MLVPTTGWKLTNHHKTYLSVQCDIWGNCCSSVPITHQCLKTLLTVISFLCGSGFGMLQKKHPGDLPPTVPDLPPPSQRATAAAEGVTSCYLTPSQHITHLQCFDAVAQVKGMDLLDSCTNPASIIRKVSLLSERFQPGAVGQPLEAVCEWLSWMKVKRV